MRMTVPRIVVDYVTSNAVSGLGSGSCDEDCFRTGLGHVRRTVPRIAVDYVTTTHVSGLVWVT